jgi:UDP-glucose 4-epimerase
LGRPFRVVATSAAGGFATRTVKALLAAGHKVGATDRPAHATNYYEQEHLSYIQADLTDAGSASALTRDVDVIVHATAMPTPQFHPAHVVFANNLIAAFNMVEAAGSMRRVAIHERLQ